MKRRLPALLLCTLFAAGGTASADTLLIEGLDAGSGPHRGMSMDSVEARYGAPVAKRPAVGDPPISRWEYPGFVVYFEHQYVIHSVEKRGRS